MCQLCIIKDNPVEPPYARKGLTSLLFAMPFLLFVSYNTFFYNLKMLQ